jgi:pyruvate/2-oxoacid:ferredoxin oxidoreductase alpha subunit
MTMKAALALVAALACAPAAQAQAQAQVQDLELGRLLYQIHCIGCHYEHIHERDRSKSLVRSLAELRTVVGNRAKLTGREFTPQELDDIAAYLDRRHYRFRQ